MKKKSGATEVTNNFNLFISSKYNELIKKYITTFRLETSQTFTTFRYDIDVEETFYENQINYKLVGLKTPRLLVPGGGPAVFEKEYASLKGKYVLKIIGLDDRESIFGINVSKNKIKILTTPNDIFININIQN